MPPTPWGTNVAQLDPFSDIPQPAQHPRLDKLLNVQLDELSYTTLTSNSLITRYIQSNRNLGYNSGSLDNLVWGFINIRGANLSSVVHIFPSN